MALPVLRFSAHHVLWLITEIGQNHCTCSSLLAAPPPYCEFAFGCWGPQQPQVLSISNSTVLLPRFTINLAVSCASLPHRKAPVALAIHNPLLPGFIFLMPNKEDHTILLSDAPIFQAASSGFYLDRRPLSTHLAPAQLRGLQP